MVDLASREYSRCVTRYLRPGRRCVTCVFGEVKDGKVIGKGTLCKMARGEMVRFMAERRINEPEELKAFDRLNYCFDADHSDEDTYVFIRK